MLIGSQTLAVKMQQSLGMVLWWLEMPKIPVAPSNTQYLSNTAAYTLDVAAWQMAVHIWVILILFAVHVIGLVLLRLPLWMVLDLIAIVNHSMFY